MYQVKIAMARISVDYSVYATAFTDSSYLCVLRARLGVLSGHYLKESGISSSAADTYIVDGTLRAGVRRTTLGSTEFGAVPSYVDSLPKSDTLTATKTYTSSFSFSGGFDRTDSATAGLSNDGLFDINIGGSTTSTANIGWQASDSVTLESKEPRLSATFDEEDSGNEAIGYISYGDYEFTAVGNANSQISTYYLDIAYIFELEKTYSSNNPLDLYLSTSVSFKQNTWWFPKSGIVSSEVRNPWKTVYLSLEDD